MSEELVIPLRDRKVRLVGKVQLLQDVASALALLPSALRRSHSSDVTELVFAGLEFLAVCTLIGLTIKELKENDDDIRGVSWTNIIIGVLLIIENTLRVHEGQHKVFSPTLLTGVSSLVIGLGQGRLMRRKGKLRAVRISDTHLFVRLSKFHQFSRPWSEIARIEEQQDSLLLIARDGKSRRIKLKRYDNGADVRTAITDHARKHAVTLTRGG